MELSDYISQTLTQIIEGVRNAQEFAKEHGSIINGSNFYQFSTESKLADGKHIVQNVEFNVAISITETDDSKGGIGVFAGAFGIGVHGSTGSQIGSINQIKFSIPILLPIQQEEKIERIPGENPYQNIKSF